MDQQLILIYDFRASQSLDGYFIPASYIVRYFFSAHGLLDWKELIELSKTVPSADHENLSFSNLDDLQIFSLRVCEHYGAQKARLISVQDFNIGIDGAKDLTSYKAIFEKYGDSVVNESRGKKGLFSKFFS